MCDRSQVADRRSTGGATSATRDRRPATWLAITLLLVTTLACHREQRRLDSPAPASARPLPVRVSDLQPGPKSLGAAARLNPYTGNAWAASQGQQLFARYNCVGCHAHGGGGMGPPLMDEEWIYGNSPANLYNSISEGRPNGMPSYGGHIPAEQVWQLVTYVRVLGSLEPQTIRPPRAEEMQSRRAEEPR